MEHYRKAMRDIEKERANFLAKIDLVKPSFEEQHQLDVSATNIGVKQFKSFTLHPRKSARVATIDQYAAAARLCSVW